jgi:alpha/beta superfamily hydrolase
MPDLMLHAPEGDIEVKYHRNEKSDAPLAIVLHPHPEHGGTMNNKVVYSLYQVFSDLGFHVARFNFRGVGRSFGKFDFGDGELRDATYVFEWMKSEFPDAKDRWCAGFSFGSWVAMQLIKKEETISHFVCAGTPANVYDFSFLLPFDRPGVFLQGSDDLIVSPVAAQALCEKMTQLSDRSFPFFMIENADHFFTGKLEEFKTMLATYIKQETSTIS